MMRRRVLSLLLVTWATGAWAQGVPAGAPAEAELPAAPEEGLDPDLSATLDRARAALERRDPTAAAQAVIRVHLSTDRFTRAQAESLKGPSRTLLGDAARLQLQNGHLDLAAQALDVAWELDGRKPDPEYARVLVSWAEKLQESNKGQALYLARRAQVVDPKNGAAAALDFSLSHNKNLVPARVMEVTAITGLVTGLLLTYVVAPRMSSAQGDTFRLASYGAFGLAAVGAAGSYLLLSAGEPRYEPTSPELLPVLPK